MKSFKLIALAALVLSVTAQSAMAVGRATSTEEVTAESFMCEKLAARQLKSHAAATDVRGSERRDEREQTGTVRSSM